MTETFPLTSGATHYACFFQGANVFNATSQAMVAASGATQSQCSIAMSEIGSSGLFYITTAPTGLPAGRYTIIVFKEASPAPSPGERRHEASGSMTRTTGADRRGSPSARADQGPLPAP
jgi:hypothetical protein